MRGQLTAQYTVNMPANIAVHACGPSFTAALVSERARIVDCHGKVVSSEVTMHRVRVGLATGITARGFTSSVIVSEEVRERCRGGGGR